MRRRRTLLFTASLFVPCFLLFFTKHTVELHLVRNKATATALTTQRIDPSSSSTTNISLVDTTSWEMPPPRMAPIVSLPHRLIYFFIPKNGCTTWKQILQHELFYSNDLTTTTTQTNVSNLRIHKRGQNGLQYLDSYKNMTQVQQWILDPKWTKAVIVRDPKARFLSAFFNKAYQQPHHPLVRLCCRRVDQKDPHNTTTDTESNAFFSSSQDCQQQVSQSVDAFFQMIQFCHDVHWMVQTKRYNPFFWKHMNFVGHFENFRFVSLQLAQRLNISKDHVDSFLGQHNVHPTNATDKMKQFISPELDTLLNEYYRLDYQNQYMGYTEYSLYP